MKQILERWKERKMLGDRQNGSYVWWKYHSILQVRSGSIWRSGPSWSGTTATTATTAKPNGLDLRSCPPLGTPAPATVLLPEGKREGEVRHFGRREQSRAHEIGSEPETAKSEVVRENMLHQTTTSTPVWSGYYKQPLGTKYFHTSSAMGSDTASFFRVSSESFFPQSISHTDSVFKGPIVTNDGPPCSMSTSMTVPSPLARLPAYAGSRCGSEGGVMFSPSAPATELAALCRRFGSVFMYEHVGASLPLVSSASAAATLSRCNGRMGNAADTTTAFRRSVAVGPFSFTALYSPPAYP
ncbi:hypothetical protein B0H66DRAFT_529200 [Apodospora peruviana]|uniref:Uncharacterized protein n=1 Tax=Apodospora peruviana TaxID=516989 RepID=A0AAE0IHH0_9PEZI|nr:hypothetical protein B0H66DRAFT_529200 [Apodospora peruviana]